MPMTVSGHAHWSNYITCAPCVHLLHCSC